MNCICCATKFDAELGPCPRCSWNPNLRHTALAGYAVGDTVKKRYVIREALGKGRLGVVLKAVDKEKNKPVILKFIHPGLIPDDDAGMRFLTAMNAIKNLGDARLAPPIEAARDKGRYFISREFLVGVPLKQLMDDQRICGQVFPGDEAVQIIEKLARALVSIRGGSHGSFSPSKIWILAKDLKIVDYGLASALPAAAVWHALRSGPGASFAAPEQFDNRPPDQKGDVYALGVLLGEMLSLAEFDGDVDIFRASEPDLSHEMEALIRCSLSVDADARYDHPMEFVSALYDITGRPRSLTMPPDNTAVVPAAFLNQLRSMSQVPPPDVDDNPVGEITKQVALDAVAQQSNLISTSPPNAPTPVEPPAPPSPRPFSPPPFRPTDMGALARATAKAAAPNVPHRAPPPASAGRKSLPPPVPSPDRTMIPKPDDLPAVLKAPQTTAPPPPAPRPSIQTALPKKNDEISALKAMLTPRPMPAFDLTDSPDLEIEEIELEPDLPESTAPPADPRPTADSMEAFDRYEGINPRFLRAAAKLEKAQVTNPPVENERISTPDEDEWRRQLEASTAGSVISFLPPSTIENPAVVEGFPENQRNRAPKGTMRPVSPPTPPPLPRRK